MSKQSSHPIVLPMHYPDWKDTKEIRYLVIDAAAWGEAQRRAFIEKLDQTPREGRKVFKANVFERAWVFFVGAERVYNQVEFEFTLPEAAITAFVCNMPLQHRPVRGINTGVPPLVPKSDQSVQFPFPDPIASVDGPSANKSNGRGSLTTKRAAQLSGKNVDVRAIGRRCEIHSVSGGPESGSFSTTVKAIHDLLERTRSLKTEPFRHQPEAI